MNTQQLELGNIITLESPSQQKQNQETTGRKFTKVCRLCNQEKPISQFDKHIAHKDNLDTRCRPCRKKYTKHLNNLKKQYPKPNPGPCPICGKHVEKWILDHCHETGRFRAYICDSCNLGLGKFNDDVEIIKKAIAYLTTT